ncbi:MAG TPA: F0F1 ATP synthase subunit gamma [Polyangia bacterium]|nr:F0F1 ATP synthase subunit gamma [Polyangia bacterium]
MSERGTEVRARVGTMNELAEVLGAMRGMAAARIQQGERARAAAQEYAARIGAALASLDADAPARPPAAPTRPPRTLVVALCTERGFVGGLNERVVRAAEASPPPREILIVGARGLSFARERGLSVTYAGDMPTHVGGLGDVADQIGDRLVERMNDGELVVVDVIHPRRTPAGGTVVERQRLLPRELLPRPTSPGYPPLTMLPAPVLAAQIALEYLHAQLVAFAAESFAAANAASLEVLQAAHAHLDDMLVAARRTQNAMRQEEITAEVLEVITGRLTGASKT